MTKKQVCSNCSASQILLISIPTCCFITHVSSTFPNGLLSEPLTVRLAILHHEICNRVSGRHSSFNIVLQNLPSVPNLLYGGSTPPLFQRPHVSPPASAASQYRALSSTLRITMPVANSSLAHVLRMVGYRRSSVSGRSDLSLIDM